MLIIHIPNTYLSERSYIIKTIFHDFWDININLCTEERNDVLIKLKDQQSEGTLRIADVLFQIPKKQWLTRGSLPQQPLNSWEPRSFLGDISLATSSLPIIYGKETRSLNSSNCYLAETDKEIYLGLDIFGSAFFMLTRYEEYIKPDRDQHDRFPATASLAYQEGFLDRPIINEYIEILWYCMKRLWPKLERKQRSFRTIVSHDVDVPFAQVFTGISKLMRNCGGDILKRRSPVMVLKRFHSWKAVKKGDYKQDMNYTFDRIMDISEQNNMKSAFYFKTACTNEKFDNEYSIDHPYIRQLMREIHNRGHEIGFHPSYETYRNPEQTKFEFKKLQQVCDEENIQQRRWGGRQHYLRWRGPVTWQNWTNAGLNYDSTLSYADYAGFRCGICYQYPVYDLHERKQLQLAELPLIIMEGSIFGEQYMNLTGGRALCYMYKLKQHCRQFDGDFTLLWHNSSFYTLKMWEGYENLINNYSYKKV